MPDRVGFISEHTAEYFLVQSLMRACERRGIDAIPLYYWSTREGGRIGMESGLGVHVRVAAIFPRRPKVGYAGAKNAIIKFNHSVFEAKAVGDALGLPVFAGAPIASSLFALRSTTRCAWFDLCKDPVDGGDAYCYVDMQEDQPEFAPDAEVGVLTEAELLERIESGSKLQDWSEWARTLREFKRATGRGRFVFGAAYKPFYLVILS